MRPSALLALTLVPALAAAQLAALEKLADLTEGAVKKGLGLFLNETQIEQISRAHEVVPHKYAGKSGLLRRGCEGDQVQG